MGRSIVLHRNALVTALRSARVMVKRAGKRELQVSSFANALKEWKALGKIDKITHDFTAFEPLTAYSDALKRTMQHDMPYIEKLLATAYSCTQKRGFKRKLWPKASRCDQKLSNLGLHA